MVLVCGGGGGGGGGGGCSVLQGIVLSVGVLLFAMMDTNGTELLLCY